MFSHHALIVIKVFNDEVLSVMWYTWFFLGVDWHTVFQKIVNLPFSAMLFGPCLHQCLFVIILLQADLSVYVDKLRHCYISLQFDKCLARTGHSEVKWSLISWRKVTHVCINLATHNYLCHDRQEFHAMLYYMPKLLSQILTGSCFRPHEDPLMISTTVVSCSIPFTILQDPVKDLDWMLSKL